MIELIGVKLAAEDRVRGGPWVAEMIRDQDGRVLPVWLHGKRDYSRANSKGSRGVRVHYILEEDRLYWVQEPRSWRETIRYFAAVNPDGSIRKLTDHEAAEWRSAL